ncbi:MAG: SpoIIE family protein phosphatase [Phycisphaerae bacterium]
MSTASITSSESFQARLLRSEVRRSSIMAALWLVMLAGVLWRRWRGDMVMLVNPMFFAAVGTFASALCFQAWVCLDSIHCCRRGRRRFRGSWAIGVAFDVAVPLAYLVFAHLHSPRSTESTLSGPVILCLPLVTMISILRLRPAVSFATGVIAAVGHASLVVWTIIETEMDANKWPLYFSYAIILVLTGIAAAFVASEARAYVGEAVRETLESELQQRELANIERDLSIARDIQRGLMPTGSPDLQGFEIVGMARPAQHTGGDYYDWQRLPDGRLVVALADVTGHGIGPAIVMAVCRAYARASAPTSVDAAALLNRLNELICPDVELSGRFITMVIAVVSPDGSVELISAGHGPTLLLRAASGEIESFSGDGIPLGIDPAERYANLKTRRLERGDALLMVTDGFFEWQRADGEQFGTARLEHALRSATGQPAGKVIEAIDAAARAFAAEMPQGDDTTAVVIRRI